MIRYSLTLAELEAKITGHDKNWIDQARARTKIFEDQGYYDEKSSIWSGIKPVYMNLQGESKCAYCEQKLESVTYGKGVQDVEHFRPKKKVSPWKPAKSAKLDDVPFTEPKAADGGYHLLAYHIFNYCASCKPCNSALKRDYFPIAGTYQTMGGNPPRGTVEKPYLIYPIGNIDTDPAALIRFEGVTPVSAKKNGHSWNRARVTIEFFKLNDALGRKNLFRERAMVLVALLPQLRAAQSGGPAGQTARKLVKAFTADTAPHANCARCFRDLFERDPNAAGKLAEDAHQHLLSIS